jgi:hypothetical protein
MHAAAATNGARTSDHTHAKRAMKRAAADDATPPTAEAWMARPSLFYTRVDECTPKAQKNDELVAVHDEYKAAGAARSARVAARQPVLT